MRRYKQCQVEGMTPIGYDDDDNEVIHSNRGSRRQSGSGRWRVNQLLSLSRVATRLTKEVIIIVNLIS